MRVAIAAVLAAALLPSAAFAQSQDSQSVAEAARRAREQKKTPAKPAKVITEDDVKPATPASSEPPPASGAPNPPAGQASAGSAAADPKDEKTVKEIADLKEQIKQAQSNLDLAQRQLSLEQDNYFSKPDYTRDTAGKAKVDELKRQLGDKQQELNRLKARLAEMQPASAASPVAPPKS
jgi:predicted RNase H-like nuclease (RuvC/YqgF family)